MAQDKKNAATAVEQQSKKGKGFVRGVKDTFGELGKVSWPTFKEVVKKTGIVIGVSIVFLIIVTGIDIGLSQLYKLLIQGLV